MVRHGQRFITLEVTGPRKVSRRRKKRLKATYLAIVFRIAEDGFALDYQRCHGRAPSAKTRRAFRRSFGRVERATFVSWKRT